jgi:hypothetical protein
MTTNYAKCLKNLPLESHFVACGEVLNALLWWSVWSEHSVIVWESTTAWVRHRALDNPCCIVARVDF